MSITKKSLEMVVRYPRDIRQELELDERTIRRADRQKLHQPLNKKMTADAYAAYLGRQL